ncbi:MAG TPA: aldolase/citrate lyase family protein, partial [Novosphingobium sp.]|nr:aldolase/citrate lyase family protein [Novosphingobium sp.]
MNSYEKQMLAILIEGRERHGFASVKAEFEAEGTRSDEFLRLLELARRAGLKVALKIGGCEAIRDLIEARQYGVDYIIAPMVETPYALSKFIAAKDKVFPADEQQDIEFLFNVETHDTFLRIEEMATIAQAGNVGMVFGRVDFAGSLGHTRDFVNGAEMTDFVAQVAGLCEAHALPLVVGGGVSPASVPLLGAARARRLDRFETRKVVFDAGVL